VTSASNALAALKPADDIEADWKSFIRLKKQEAALITAIRHKVDAGDRTGLDDLATEPDLAKQVEAAAAEVGAGACAAE
jgi:hypothetical protein